jgi:hypothetical protein
MEKIKYEILQKKIQTVELVSLTSQNWYDSNRDLYPWSGTTVGPEVNDVVYNTGGDVPIGYYKWSGTIWVLITISEVYENHNILLSLENTIDDLGVMVGFNGDIEQVEQLCNFTYSGTTGSTIISVYNSVNSDKLRTIVEQNFTIDWGDGTPTGTIGSTEFSSLSHTYVSGGTYNVSIFLMSPWTIQKLTKSITVPFDDPNIIDNEFGTFTGYTITGGTFTQDYLTDLDTNTGVTPDAMFTYVAIGGSKIDQKKLYGTDTYVGVTTGMTEDLIWSGYTIDDFYYRDYSDGYTMITGSTVGFQKEEVPNLCLTRNEHFIGFVDEPTIYSDIFVERGKQGVMEKNLRLCEIDNVGEVELYGNGYFNVKKQ